MNYPLNYSPKTLTQDAREARFLEFEAEAEELVGGDGDWQVLSVKTCRAVFDAVPDGIDEGASLTSRQIRLEAVKFAALWHRSIGAKMRSWRLAAKKALEIAEAIAPGSTEGHVLTLDAFR